jgi:hypothetical protein
MSQGYTRDGALNDSVTTRLYVYVELGRGVPEIIETGRKISAGNTPGSRASGTSMTSWDCLGGREAATQILELV